MIQPPPRATLNDTLFPCSTLFRSKIRADAPQLDLVACAVAQRRAGLQRQLLEVAVDQPVRENVAFGERHAVGEAEIEREPLGRHVGRQDRKGTRLNPSHYCASRMSSSAGKQNNEIPCLLRHLSII